MFRLAFFALASLIGSASAVTCPFPEVVRDGSQTVFSAGDNWNDEANANGGPEVWFELTVEDACDVFVTFNTCDSGSPDVTLYVYKEVTDCNSLPTPVLEKKGGTNGNCNLSQVGLDGGVQGAFSHKETAETTYLIRVEAQSGSLGNVDIQIQGSLIGTCGGDPHFRRWGNEIRDSFHGECDLVLFHNDEVAGKELDVHVRTTIQDAYSYVSGVAMKYGNDRIEFQHDAMYVNGVKPEDESIIEFGDNSQIVMVDAEKRKFQVHVEGQVTVDVYSTKHFMGVAVNGKSKGLADSAGILGQYGTGAMLARDGSEMSDFQDFGFEWQVSPADPKIFMDDREPQLPYERCRMPSVSAAARRRKLRGQDRKLYEQAVSACAENQIPENMQSCIDDVMFTGELDLAYVV